MVIVFVFGAFALATLPYGTTDIIVAAVAIGVGMALCARYCLYRRPILPSTLHARIRPDEDKAIVLIPHRKQIVNVIPA
ncbi:hypothetical protein [Amycolatopsis sp. NPDC051372]|uniref:hypothetical protein n=1 Tax=unclassified Amycolatopsis TaxID=2618356 RepID=UPI003439BEB1